MEVRFVLPDLEQLDAIRCDALAVSFFADELPTRGALGLVDWRLCGLISRMVVQKRIEGSWGETILLPGYPRLAMDKLLLLGLGASADFHPGLLGKAVEHMLAALSRAAARTSAVVLPGRGAERVDPAAAIDALIRVSAAYPEHDEIIVVEKAEARKSMTPLLERERRRARSGIE